MFFKSESYPFIHSLVSYFNHVLLSNRTEVNVKSTNSTLVCWLQNEQGYQLYKPTDTAIDAFLESYRPGKDKNIEATVAESTVTTTSSTAEANNKT